MPVSGSVVALSGATSGLHSTTVDKTAYSVPTAGSYYGPMRTTWSNICLGGDSGGPWLSTTSNKRTVAHGQHHGIYQVYPGVQIAYCVFFDINTVSAANSATLVTG